MAWAGCITFCVIWAGKKMYDTVTCNFEVNYFCRFQLKIMCTSGLSSYLRLWWIKLYSFCGHKEVVVFHDEYSAFCLWILKLRECVLPSLRRGKASQGCPLCNCCCCLETTNLSGSCVCLFSFCLSSLPLSSNSLSTYTENKWSIFFCPVPPCLEILSYFFFWRPNLSRKEQIMPAMYLVLNFLNLQCILSQKW